MPTTDSEVRGHVVSPIAHVVKVLGELSQVRTLLLVLLLGPKQNFGNLDGKHGKS